MKLAASACVLGLDPMLILTTTDPAEAAVYQSLVGLTDEYQAKVDEARANRIANAVSKRIFGK